MLQAKYQQGLEEAFAEGAKGVKRGCGEDEEKNKPDEKMEDEKETSVLNPAQVVAAFRPRIKREADELRQLENASAKEVVPVTQAPVAAANALAPCKAKEEEQESRRQPITAGRRLNKWEATSEAAEASMEADGEQKTEGGAPQKAQKTRKQHPPIEAQLEILMQERMQKQQEVERLSEISRVQRMAVVQTAVRKAANEIEKARTMPY